MISWAPGITLAEMEKRCILEAFKWYRSNKTQTAQALGISIRTLDGRLEQYETDSKKEKTRYDEEQTKRQDILARLRGVPQPANSFDAYTGPSMEPAPQVPAQLAVPMPERKEVQELSSRQTVQSGAKRHR